MNLESLFPDGAWTDPKHTRQEHPCPFCQRTIPWAQFPSGIKVAGHGCGHTSEEIVAAVMASKMPIAAPQAPAEAVSSDGRPNGHGNGSNGKIALPEVDHKSWLMVLNRAVMDDAAEASKLSREIANGITREQRVEDATELMRRLVASAPMFRPPSNLTPIEIDEEIQGAAEKAIAALFGVLVPALPDKKHETNGHPVVVRPALLGFIESKALAAAADARPHVIQDLITAQDIFGLAAKKGIGKSTLLRQMAIAVAAGEPFLGLQTNPTRVWYIDLEPGNQQKRHEKFEQLGWNERSRNLVLTVSPPVAGQSWAFEWLEEHIVKEQFGLIIIDTLFKFCKVEQGNDYSSGLYGTAPLEGIAERTKAAIGIAHHAPKNANPNSANVSAADLFLGAVSIAGSFGVCLAMRRQRGGSGGSRVSLFMDPPRYTRQVIEGEWLLEMDPITNQISLGDTVKKDWWNRIQADVKYAAQEIPKDDKGDYKAFTASDILDRLDGYKRNEIKRVLNYLAKNNYLDVLGKEDRRGGAVRYRIKSTAELVAAPATRGLFD